MDSFFKAAVSDLDKVLDDFELNSDESESSPAISGSESQSGSSDPHNFSSLPDLRSLHDDPSGNVKSTVIGSVAGVDLLSSVDPRPPGSSTPMSSDRALEPVCDLVNDTSSALWSHQVSDQLDEEEKKKALPVDEGQVADPEDKKAFFSSLSLLDVILPASKSESAATPPPPPRSLPLPGKAKRKTLNRQPTGKPKNKPKVLSKPRGLERKSDKSLSLKAKAGTSNRKEYKRNERSSSEERDLTSTDLPYFDTSEGSPKGPPEFGFESLPESDQARHLVTDEELDAFLQEQAEAEQVPYRDFFEGCPQGEVEKEPAFPESDQLPFCSNQANLDMQSFYGAVGLKELYFPNTAEVGERSTAKDPQRSLPEGHAESTEETPKSMERQPEPAEEHLIPSEEHPGSSDEQPGMSKECPTSAEEEPISIEEEPISIEEEPISIEEEPISIEELPISIEEEPISTEEDPISIEDFSLENSSQDCSGEYDEVPQASTSSTCRRRTGAERLGNKQPMWVPDSHALACMMCASRFTFTRRRHHCRACGKIFCAGCCNRKCRLNYLGKEARVCIRCHNSIRKAQALERMMSPTSPTPNPNVPSEYCSTVPPLQQAEAAGTLTSPPPTVMVPVSVLKHPNPSGASRERKRVWFADGVFPNGELVDSTKMLSATHRRSLSFYPEPFTSVSTALESVSSDPEGSEEQPVRGPWDLALVARVSFSVRKVPSLLPEDERELPPLLISTGEDGREVFVEENPAHCQILLLLEEGGPYPLTFVLNANLVVNVKYVKHSNKQCWFFGSNGLQILGQQELVFLIERLPEEKKLPREMFSLYLTVYRDAQRGKFVRNQGNVMFTSSFLGSKDHAGMVFFNHTCQPLEELHLPKEPFLFGFLIQKLEVPWAKVFPLRLLLRLGAEYQVYPSAIISIRFRKSVYQEPGHTIMNLLADLRNYQYKPAVVDGLQVLLEMGHSYIEIPKCKYNEIQKILNSSNEHVVSIGANFSPTADSHLVCYQNPDGTYKTQANSLLGEARTVTGASFVVFNGALKASTGYIAKSSIVEDGLMVQIPPDTMDALRAALKDQRDYHILCGRTDGKSVQDNVTVRWTDWTSTANAGRISGVDDRPLDDIPSAKTLRDSLLFSDSRYIRCSEIFYKVRNAETSMASVMSSCSVFQKSIAAAMCSSLVPHLGGLLSSGINSLTVRVSRQDEMVEYQVGSCGKPLPQRFMSVLDSALIPVIHGPGANVPTTFADLEFLFYICNSV